MNALAQGALRQCTQWPWIEHPAFWMQRRTLYHWIISAHKSVHERDFHIRSHKDCYGTEIRLKLAHYKKIAKLFRGVNVICLCSQHLISKRFVSVPINPWEAAYCLKIAEIFQCPPLSLSTCSLRPTRAKTCAEQKPMKLHVIANEKMLTTSVFEGVGCSEISGDILPRPVVLKLFCTLTPN